MTRYFRCDNQAAIQLISHCGSRGSILIISLSWSTKSKAFAKSKKIAITCWSPQSIARPQSSRTKISASVVHLPGKKPNCLFERSFILVRYKISFYALHLLACSRCNSDRAHVSSRSFDTFGIGVMLPSQHSSMKMPLFTQWLKIVTNGDINSRRAA